MIVMREVFKRDKPLDNGSGAVSLCVFRSNVNPGDAARSLREKGIEPVKKMDYDGKQYMSVRPIGKENDDDNERGV